MCPSSSRRPRKMRAKRQTKPGAAPGTVRSAADALTPVIRVMAYGPDTLLETRVDRLELLRGLMEKYAVTWIHVDGLGDAELIKRLGGLFGLHPLALEDVVHVHQRAKVEAYEDHLFLVAREARLEDPLETIQLSMFLGKNYVLTFRDRPSECLEPVRDRIRGGGPLRAAGPDYLAYALYDAVIDSYFPAVDGIADNLEVLEDQLETSARAPISGRVHSLRNDLLLLRRTTRSHRDALNELLRTEHSMVRPETRVFLRDCYDHTAQLLDLLEVYRETCSSIRDYYLTLISNRMNEIMKVLTIIATIFIPLSFITGLYGMNFNTHKPGNMPELNWPYGYVFALGLMGLTAGGLVMYFRHKGWIVWKEAGGGRREVSRTVSTSETNPTISKAPGLLAEEVVEGEQKHEGG